MWFLTLMNYLKIRNERFSKDVEQKLLICIVSGRGHNAKYSILARTCDKSRVESWEHEGVLTEEQLGEPGCWEG